VLRRYVQIATGEGVTQAVFLEGRLTSDGALQSPKLGLLDYMVRAFEPGSSRDVVFVPVGINFDRTLEDRTVLLREDPTVPASFRSGAVFGTFRFLLRNLRLLIAGRWHRFGYACVNFGTPFSLRRFLADRDLDPRSAGRESRFETVEELAGRLMQGVARVIPVLPVSLVATVFADSPEEPLSLLELKSRVQRLIREVEARDAHVYVPRRDRDYAIEVGLRMLTLRRLVLEVNGLYLAPGAELPVLRYYANAIRHHVSPA
jgi:glycerol-3-phosphate O-acyltransferase